MFLVAVTNRARRESRNSSSDPREPSTFCSSCVPGPAAPAGHRVLGAYVELKISLGSPWLGLLDSSLRTCGDYSFSSSALVFIPVSVTPHMSLGCQAFFFLPTEEETIGCA